MCVRAHIMYVRTCVVRTYVHWLLERLLIVQQPFYQGKVVPHGRDVTMCHNTNYYTEEPHMRYLFQFQKIRLIYRQRIRVITK